MDSLPVLGSPIVDGQLDKSDRRQAREARSTGGWLVLAGQRSASGLVLAGLGLVTPLPAVTRDLN